MFVGIGWCVVRVVGHSRLVYAGGSNVGASGGVIGDLIGDTMEGGEVKQEGGSVDAWCVSMSQRRNRGTLMAVRPRIEGRGSVFKGMLEG